MENTNAIGTSPTRREKMGDACLKAGEKMGSLIGVNATTVAAGGTAAGMGLAAMTPTVALAVDAKETLDNFLPKLSGGVIFLGGVLIVFGVVNLGLNLKDGAQGGGGQLAGAITSIVGGALVVAAGVYFGTLDTGWMNS